MASAATTGRLAATVIAEPADLEPWLERWDALSLELAAPFSGPAWLLGWWRHAAGGTRELRTVVVSEGDELVGIAPTFAQIGPLGLAEYRLLGAGASHRIGPLAVPGREGEVAEAAARALNDARPRLSSLVLEGLDAASPWPQLLRAAWPGATRPRRHVGLVLTAPALEIQGDFDAWLGTRSSNFRQQMRRQRRRLEERGARIAMAESPEETRRCLEALFALHRLRFESKEEHSDLTPGIEEHLREAATALPPERFRLWGVEVAGEYVAAQLHVAAGGHLSYWNGGFDPAWERYKPSLVTLFAVLEDAFRRGDRRFDLGGGDQPYKWRFADHDDPLMWSSLFPRNRRYPLTRLQLMPKEARLLARRLARRLPPGLKERLHRARG
ncbi:MAG TPA: GNAT family N-acetyltransferase [Thermoleophilaceae bacterium]|nr:GNAT family N-acetyltransferase [Thermoleophilaceae bacterium]